MATRSPTFSSPHLGPDLHDLAHVLVAEDVAHAHERRQRLVQVQVRAADVRRRHPDDRVRGLLHEGVGHLLDAHVPLSVPGHCLHGSPVVGAPRRARSYGAAPCPGHADAREGRNSRSDAHAGTGVTAGDALTLFDDPGAAAEVLVDDRMLRVRHIYAEPAALASPRGRQVLARFPDAEVVEVPSHWQIPELHGNAPGNVDRWVRVKTETLVLGVKKSLSARPNERSANWIAPSTANGCTMACAYCYVPRRKGYANPVTGSPTSSRSPATCAATWPGRA